MRSCGCREQGSYLEIWLFRNADKEPLVQAVQAVQAVKHPSAMPAPYMDPAGLSYSLLVNGLGKKTMEDGQAAWALV